MKKELWSGKELNLVEKYFNSSMTLFSLFHKVHELNPDRTYYSVKCKIWRLKRYGHRVQKKENVLKTLRVGYFDIEATNLDGDFGFMLSWYIKKAGHNEYDCSVITKKEIFEGRFDYRLVVELLEAFKNYDVLYTHYGSDRRFDIPFIRTRAYENGLEEKLPNYMDNFIMDTYPIARNKLKLHSNRLDSIAECVGVRGVKKTPLSSRVWKLAAVGNAYALKYIVLHNKRDVQILERVHKKLIKIERPIYHSI